MAVYIITFIICYFFLFLSNYKDTGRRSDKLITIILSFLPLLIVATIRGKSVGTDYLMYNNFFYDSGKLHLFKKDLEFVFVLFCKVFHFFFNEPVIMFMTIYLILYFVVYKSALKKNKYYELTIFLFIAFGFYTNTFNVLRQWMAIPLLYLGMHYICEKDSRRGVLLFIIGLLCHYTSVLTIPIFYLCTKIKSDKTRVLIIILSIIMFLNLNTFMQLLYNLFVKIHFSEKYLKYFIRADYNSLNTNIFVMPMFTLVTYIGYIILIKKKVVLSKHDNFLINCVIIGFMTALIGTRNTMFQRIQLYFVYSLIFVIPYILENYKSKHKTILYLSCIVLGMIFFIYSLGKNGGEVLPYITIFS